MADLNNVIDRLNLDRHDVMLYMKDKQAFLNRRITDDAQAILQAPAVIYVENSWVCTIDKMAYFKSTMIPLHMNVKVMGQNEADMDDGDYWEWFSREFSKK